MKYIIKNCPACKDYNIISLPEKGCCYAYVDYCRNHPECLLKRIVEKCKEARRTGRKAYLALEILDLLEIEECE